jgi:hypothetical protein
LIRFTPENFLYSNQKSKGMKLSKSLLGAIMIGITIQTTVVSCGKDEQPKPKDNKVKQSSSQPERNIGSCPACGMG